MHISDNLELAAVRQPPSWLGVCAATVALASVSAPACANSAATSALVSLSEPHTARYDHASRTLFIGSEPDSPTGDSPAQITISRAADLVGRPLNLIRPLWSRSLASGGARAHGTLGIPFGMPVSATALTSSFGVRNDPLLGGLRAHSGIDFAARTGSPITATSDGMVTKANWFGGYGLFISLEHGGGVQTRYGHMSRLNVLEGQRVRKGDIIGYVGSTGRSTGSHLHYEVRVNGQAINPMPSLRGH